MPSYLQRGAPYPPSPPDLVNVFEVFLPQLLLYPNPTDPLNGEAAALLMRDPSGYASRVKGAPLGRGRSSRGRGGSGGLAACG